MELGTREVVTVKRAWHYCGHPNSIVQSTQQQQKTVNNNWELSAKLPPTTMASLANVPYILGPPNTHHKPHNNINNNNFKSLCRHFPFHRNIWWVSATTVTPKRNSSTITCFAANKPSSSTEIRFSLIFVFTEFNLGVIAMVVSVCLNLKIYWNIHCFFYGVWLNMDTLVSKWHSNGPLYMKGIKVLLSYNGMLLIFWSMKCMRIWVWDIWGRDVITLYMMR